MSANEAEAAAGICAICVISAFQPWCNTKAFGGNSGNHLAGCCGSCCNKSFNEDSLDKWDKERPEKTNSQQPGPSAPMEVSAPETLAAEPVQSSTSMHTGKSENSARLNMLPKF
ncbi:hypothetical protein B0H12DRAFT_1322647 [Mycena haematopus]|nr:hypothetical protein B0H12DRAFT_1322647 [Mycena haematopus]